MKNTNNDQTSDLQQVVVEELTNIKRLLVLLLLKGGATQSEIAKALAMTQGTVSKQYGMGKVKPLETEVINSGGEE